MNILITGKPGVGKTTLIQKIVEKVELSCQGFYTREIRDQQENRVGFEIITLDGTTALLAHVEHLTPHRLGKYFVNVDNINRVIVPCIEHAIDQAQVIIIDEIGKMELFSSLFRKSVLKALASPKKVLGTITMAKLPITKKIKSRPDVILVKLKRDNQKEVYQYILDLLIEK
jgi:nucleoside-triphosphatase